MSDWHRTPIIRPIKLTACSLGFYPVLSVSQTEPNPCAEMGVSSALAMRKKEKKTRLLEPNLIMVILLIYERGHCIWQQG